MRVMCGKKQINIQRNKQTLNDKFHVFFPDCNVVVFALSVYYFSEVFKACFESVWSSYQLKSPFR